MEKYILLNKVLNFGNRKISRGQNLVSTGHVKGMAVAFQLQTGKAKLHTFGTKANCNCKIMAFFS